MRSISCRAYLSLKLKKKFSIVIRLSYINYTSLSEHNLTGGLKEKPIKTPDSSRTVEVSAIKIGKEEKTIYTGLKSADEGAKKCQFGGVN